MKVVGCIIAIALGVVVYMTHRHFTELIAREKTVANAKIKKAQADLESSRALYQQEIGVLEEQKGDVTGEVKQLTSRVQKEKDEGRNLTDRIDRLTRSVNSCRTQIQAVSAKQDQLLRDKEVTQEDTVELEGALEVLQDGLERLKPSPIKTAN